MKPSSKPTPVPARVNSALLAKFLQPGEPVIIVKLCDLGMTQDYELQTSGRTFLFRWDYKRTGHILRVPHSVWHAQEEEVAHQVMQHRRLRAPMVVTVEMGTGADGPPTAYKNHLPSASETATASSAETSVPSVLAGVYPDTLETDSIPGLGDPPMACVDIFTEPGKKRKLESRKLKSEN